MKPERDAAGRLVPGDEVLSTYELTQSQWSRFTGRSPSIYVSPAPNALHPVEGVTWPDAMRGLPRMGLLLPSEAQWEERVPGRDGYAVALRRRAGAAAGEINIADRTAAAGAVWGAILDWPDHEDGGVVYREVGAAPSCAAYNLGVRPAMAIAE